MEIKPFFNLYSSSSCCDYDKIRIENVSDTTPVFNLQFFNNKIYNNITSIQISTIESAYLLISHHCCFKKGVWYLRDGIVGYATANTDDLKKWLEILGNTKYFI